MDHCDLAVDSANVVHQTTTVSFFACGRAGKSVWTQNRRLRWADTGLFTIHSTYYFYYFFSIIPVRKVTL